MTKARVRVSFRLSLMAAAVAVLAIVGSASAGQIFSEQFHDEEEFPEADFCGEAGLDVTWNITRDGRPHAVSRGRDKLPYFGFNFKAVEVVTNDANGNFVTSHVVINDKDLRVTDNGDGTLTLLILTTAMPRSTT